MSVNVVDLTKVPDEAYENFVPTLNEQGFATKTLDPVSQEFVEFGPKAPGPCLDIGAAYGVATIPVIKGGATCYANDLEPKHLEVLKNQLPEESRKNLVTKPGRFPGDLDLEENTFGAVLICRVLHFFSGSDLRSALETVYKWVAPGGKLFVVCETPYIKNMQDVFTAEYERRLEAKAEWPGWIDDFSKFDEVRAKSLPKSLHLLDPTVLSREMERVGFRMERAEFLNRTDFPDFLRCDGRESVGVIGVKP